MKKIFIMTKKMESGGTEVALINLLKELVKREDTSITLGVLEKKGVYLKNIPKQVKVVEVLNEEQLLCFKKLKLNLKMMNIKKFYFVFKFKLLSKLYKRSLYEKYEEILKDVPKQREYFDIAIDFHGYGYIGTGYILEKVDADTKITFVHDEKINWMDDVKNYTDKYDKIFCVSEACKQSVIKKYPEYKNKVDIFRNIIDKDRILKLSYEYIDDMNFKGTKLLTIGRIEYQKGYDLLIDIAELLLKNNYNFRWYIIGQGSLYKDIEKEIHERKLNDNVILLGMKVNPYPYLRNCDIYVQPSRHEGYGIAIAEARILEKPIIATDLKCINEQITNRKNGLLCKFDSESFYTAIVELLENTNLVNEIKENLHKSDKEPYNDIEKLMEV